VAEALQPATGVSLSCRHAERITIWEHEMRTLVVGAGAIGWLFRGRLLDSGAGWVTFLVRPRRAAQLAQTGLVIKSPGGDFHRTTADRPIPEQLREPFDLILLSCKAYDLDDAIRSFAPAVARTAILPFAQRHAGRRRAWNSGSAAAARSAASA